MCGIAGIFRFRQPGVVDGQLRGLADAIAHRGPDGEGFWIDDERSIGLVHRRLAIIDTDPRSNQPLHSGDGRFVIVFNGEIYNYLELREELQALGHTFRTEGDTEVILEGWRRWGRELLQRMNGMWALVLHDRVSGETLLARDRFGVKPLYYGHTPEGLAFASEIRALLAVPWLDHTPDVDVARRAMFQTFDVEAGERTFVSGVRRLPAGHLAILKNGALTLERWWRTLDHLVQPPSDPAQQVERFRELFLDSIRLRLRSDVPIGTCLSGGFDSTAIACGISHVAADGGRPHQAEDWRHAFVASFPGMSNDETPEALEAARFAGITPTVLEVSQSEMGVPVETILADLDDTYLMLPTSVWQLYRNVRRSGVVVTLDGHGADELMGGYKVGGRSLLFQAKNVAEAIDDRRGDARATDAIRMAMLGASGMQFLRGAGLNAPRAPGNPFSDDPLPDRWGAFDRRLYRMFHETILPTLLRNFDRMSMAHGVEARMPFLDWRLVTYVMSLPQGMKLNGDQTKYVAREAMKGIMPESIRSSRRKVGFASPMPDWLNGPLGDWTLSRLRTPNAAFEEMVDVPALRRKVRHLNETRSWTWRASERIWPYIHMHFLLERTAR